MTNLAARLTKSASIYAKNVAVRLDDEVLTYEDLDDSATRVAGFLQSKGIKPGARVALMLPNVMAFPPLYYGILRAGAVVVPMNAQLKKREVQHYLSDSEASIVFAWSASIDEATAGAEDSQTEVVEITDESLSLIKSWPKGEAKTVTPTDTAVILYTSGTTGAPKGAQLTQSNMLLNAQIMAEGEDLLNLSPNDVIMGCLPLFHSFGQTCALNTTILSGASIVLLPRFDAQAALKIIEEQSVTVFAGVPTMYVALVNSVTDANDTSSLRLGVSGGASLPVEVLNGAVTKLGTTILEGYGLSETSPVASFNRKNFSKPGSIGQPIEGVEMKILAADGTDAPDGEVGEIAVRGHNVMTGYWKRPEATKEATNSDGWFLTGDMATRDTEGFFFIIDRKKDVINRGGYNVYPREIEEVFYEHPAVLEAAVVGIPHPSLGEDVGAAIALREGAEMTAEELREYIKERVASYKYPRTVWLVDALPKGPTGKLLKRDIQLPDSVQG